MKSFAFHQMTYKCQSGLIEVISPWNITMKSQLESFRYHNVFPLDLSWNFLNCSFIKLSWKYNIRGLCLYNLINSDFAFRHFLALFDQITRDRNANQLYFLELIQMNSTKSSRTSIIYPFIRLQILTLFNMVQS